MKDISTTSKNASNGSTQGGMLEAVSNHIKDVSNYRRDLLELAGRWDLLTLIGQISGTETEMGSTRKAFAELTEELLSRLSEETVKKAVQEIHAKAQVAVDILIRNLFERTADIGFLATDADIRRFIMAGSSKKGDAGERRNSLQARFREYVAKYSVYHNIILLDTEGKVLAQMDDQHPIEQSRDPLIAEALHTSAEYVEVFRQTDLLPTGKDELLYVYRVTESDSEDSEAIGILCLCFRFEDELEGIFGHLEDKDDWSVLTILDSKGVVIASSDRYQVPLGAKVDCVLDEEVRLIRFAGRQYLATTRPTTGYQGFMGLGWQGHVMLPLEHAFEARVKGAGLVEDGIMEAVMRNPQLFSKELRSIPVKADLIQRKLDLTVWNGNIVQATHEAKILLNNISETGAKTKEVFENSIGNLHQTVVSSILDDVTFQAALAVDIMDRNLYERANDCRWWALTSDFRHFLEKPTLDSDERESIRGILRKINSLYTVYTNLFVYDRNGKIIAVSNDAESKLEGTVLGQSWINETLALTGSQHYSVSDFENTELYGGRSTYIYGAVISSLQASEFLPIGGIGIVFDSEPEFLHMLQDSMPRNDEGAVKPGYMGVFADRKGKVISSTSGEIPVGSRLPVAREFLNCPESEGTSGIVEWNGHYYAVGARNSAGYREYKVEDTYENDITALVFASLAKVSEVNGESAKASFSVIALESDNYAKDSIEIATFLVYDRTFAFQTSDLAGALLTAGLTSIPGAHPLLAGKIAYGKQAIPVINFSKLIGLEGSESDLDDQKIIVIKTEKGNLGLLVDELGDIPVISRDKVDFSATLLDEADLYTAGVVLVPDQGDQHCMVVILDAERLQIHIKNSGTFRKMGPEAFLEMETAESEVQV